MKSWLVLLVLALPTSALAWTPEVFKSITTQANRLAPPDLKRIIDLYETEYRRGLAAAASEESGVRGSHHYSTGDGSLTRRLSSELEEAIRMVQERDPLQHFVYRLGIISHLVGDLNNPFHASDADPRMVCCKGDFERYLESRLPKIRPVFYGLEPGLDVESYLEKATTRVMGYYPLLTEEYFRDGRRRTSSGFDDRSTAFGVASLSFSHAMTDLVNIYYHIWREVGGDVSIEPTERNSERTPPGGFVRKQ